MHKKRCADRDRDAERPRGKLVVPEQQQVCIQLLMTCGTDERNSQKVPSEQKHATCKHGVRAQVQRWKRRGSSASWTAHIGLKEQTGSAASHGSRLAREEMENALGLVGDRQRAPERCQQWKIQP